MGGPRVVNIRAGKPGPKPKTDAQKRHEGTYQENRANPSAPQPAGKARRPPGLSRRERAEWDRLSPHLFKLAMLTPVDRGPFILLCKWYVIAIDAGKDAGKPGNDADDRAMNRFKKSSEIYLKLADRFGLTPAARQQLQGVLRGSSTTEEPGGQGAEDASGPRITDRHGQPI